MDLRYDTNAIILVVGPGQDKLLLHQALLVTSRCLHAACHQEPSVRAIELCLPQEDVDHVWRYVHFLYVCPTLTSLPTSLTGWLTLAQTKTIAAKVPSYTAGVTPREAELTLLCRLYVLGERFQDASFKNAIIDAMVANHREDTEKGQAYSPRGVDTSIIYGGTRAGSPGRKLMLEMHLRGGMGSSQSDHGQYDEGFLTDLCVVLLEDRCLGRTRCKEVGQGIPDGAVYHEPLG